MLARPRETCCHRRKSSRTSPVPSACRALGPDRCRSAETPGHSVPFPQGRVAADPRCRDRAPSDRATRLVHRRGDAETLACRSFRVRCRPVWGCLSVVTGKPLPPKLRRHLLTNAAPYPLHCDAGSMRTTPGHDRTNLCLFTRRLLRCCPSRCCATELRFRHCPRDRCHLSRSSSPASRQSGTRLFNRPPGGRGDAASSTCKVRA